MSREPKIRAGFRAPSPRPSPGVPGRGRLAVERFSRHNPGMISLLLATALLLAPEATPAAATEGTQLRVSTFNIRYGKAKDGENAWDKRRELFMRTVKNMDPDLLGMQEVLAFQL